MKPQKGTKTQESEEIIALLKEMDILPKHFEYSVQLELENVMKVAINHCIFTKRQLTDLCSIYAFESLSQNQWVVTLKFKLHENKSIPHSN